MSESTPTSTLPLITTTPGSLVIDRISLGLVGLNFGRWIVLDHLLAEPAFRYFHLAALCDANLVRLDNMKAELGARFTGKTYTSLDEMLDNPEIRVVGLFTGPVKRAELIRKIIRKGKDVITTKPFELDAEAALAVLKEAGELGRVVVMNSPAPVLRPDLAKIFEWQKTHRLGQAIAARTEVTVSYSEKTDGSWYDKQELCPVAPIFRIGIYLINDLCNFFHDPESVFVQHSRIRTGRPTPDNAQMGIRYRNGALANVFASFCVEDGDWYRNSLTLNFERGTVYRDVGPVRSNPSRLTLVNCGAGEKRTIVDEVEINQASDFYSWNHFHDIIKGHTPPNVTSPEQIVEGIRIVNAMSRAELANGMAIV
jgi:predicted dehydrogenase